MWAPQCGARCREYNVAEFRKFAQAARRRPPACDGLSRAALTRSAQRSTSGLAHVLCCVARTAGCPRLGGAANVFLINHAAEHHQWRYVQPGHGERDALVA